MAKITSPAFGIDMDPSHIYRAGENPAEALRPVISPRAAHPHPRLQRRGPGPGSPADQACGRGDIDLVGYCRVLVDGGYDGPVCLEVIGAGSTGPVGSVHHRGRELRLPERVPEEGVTLMKKKTNLILFGIDSLRADHMSLYGYPRLTTPHMDNSPRAGRVFEQPLSPHIPTTPGYSSMLTGMDVFGTDVVALRHEGPLGDARDDPGRGPRRAGLQHHLRRLQRQPASRGFQKYIDFSGWGSWKEGRSPRPRT